MKPEKMPRIAPTGFLIAASLIFGAATSFAQTKVGETIIQLGESDFDIRIDADEPAQSDDTVAINSVPWIRDMMMADSDLNGAIFHIRYLEPEEGVTYPWAPDRVERHMNGDLPDRFRPDGFRIAKEGGFYLFLPEASQAYYGSCYYSSFRDRLMRCSVSVRYAPDTQIRIFVSSSQLGEVGVPDFAEIAIKAHQFVQCELDVTAQDSLRRMRPDAEILPETNAPCKPVVS